MELDIFRFIILIGTFVVASYYDLKSRRIDDKIWYPIISLGFIFLIIDILVHDATIVIPEFVIGFTVTYILSYLLYKYRIFYGADHKAFVSIAIIAPSTLNIYSGYPIKDISVSSVDISTLFSDGFIYYLNQITMYVTTDVFAITVLMNTAIISVVYLFKNVVINVYNGNASVKHPLRTLTATKISTEKIDEVFVQIVPELKRDNYFYRGIEYMNKSMSGIHSDLYRDYLEWINEQNRTKYYDNISEIDELKLRSFFEDTEWESTNYEKDKQKAEQILNKEFVWVTEGIPFIVPILFAIMFATFIGNLWYVGIEILF